MHFKFVRRLTGGQHNSVYVVQDKRSEKLYILKIPATASEYDNPHRAVRVWNEVNAHIWPPAFIYVKEEMDIEGLDKDLLENKEGWLAPFFQGKQASDREMADTLIDIYNRCKRIVYDANGLGNFLTQHGETVCVDMGFALQLNSVAVDSKNEFIMTTLGVKKTRRKSEHKINVHGDRIFHVNNIMGPLNTERKTFPLSYTVIIALICLRAYRSDILDVSFLKQNQALLEKLADDYWNHLILDIEESMSALQETLTNFDEELKNHLIKNNSILLVEDRISPLLESTKSAWAAKPHSNHQKHILNVLIDRIEHAPSLEDMYSYLRSALSGQQLILESIPKELNECLAIVFEKLENKSLSLAIENIKEKIVLPLQAEYERLIQRQKANLKPFNHYTKRIEAFDKAITDIRSSIQSSEPEKAINHIKILNRNPDIIKHKPLQQFLYRLANAALIILFPISVAKKVITGSFLFHTNKGKSKETVQNIAKQNSIEFVK